MVRVLWGLLALGATTPTGGWTQSPLAACAAPSVVEASSVTLVGEIHGTAETPAWVANVACGLSQQDEVVVALEIPNSEQERLDAFMRSKGSASDQSALVGGRFWKGQDGRASEAMVALIDRLRELARQGANLTVVAIDDWHAPTSRDAAMGSAIRQIHASRPNARIVALMGNYHARTSPRVSPKSPHDQPVGYHLRDLNPLSVLVEYGDGMAWVCKPKCGPSPSRSSSGQPREPGFYPGAAWLPGYKAAINLGRVTPSPPVSQRSP